MECERSDQNDPLRQGDILAARPDSPAWTNPWTRFAVVISADCDVAQRKSGPHLVYLPIVSHQTYLADEWLPIEAGRLAKRGRDSIESKLGDYDARLAYRHISSWGENGGSENIVARLNDQLAKRTASIDPKKTGVIIAIWNAVQALDRLSQAPTLTQSSNLSELLGNLFTHRAIVSARSKDGIEDRRSIIEGALVSTQERLDTWLIRELFGLEPDMIQHNVFGYIVLLRSYSLLQIDRIETDRGKWYTASDKYLRICRLRGIYKTDLVQQFANLFVRVGLEDHRMDEHRRLFKHTAKKLVLE